MLKWLRSYFKQEMDPQTKTPFIALKLVLYLLLVLILLWNLNNPNEKPLLYWILFSIVITATTLILILSYIARKKN